MKVRLNKELVLKLYCHTFQGERSIAFALGAPWPELRQYYLGERITALRTFTTSFNEMVVRWGCALALQGREKLGPYGQPVNLFQYVFGKWITKWQNQWSFSAQVVCFQASALNALVKVLDSDIRPGQEELISLRMDLCQSRSWIEDRCYGLAELTLARRIEHFWRADWISPPLKVEDILANKPEAYLPITKKSA
jgi:hypothetical protein